MADENSPWGIRLLSASNDIAPDGIENTAAFCPAGEVPVGGNWVAAVDGGLNNNDHFSGMLYVFAEGVRGDGSYRVSVHNLRAFDTVKVTVEVWCATAAS